MCKLLSPENSWSIPTTSVEWPTRKYRGISASGNTSHTNNWQGFKIDQTGVDLCDASFQYLSIILLDPLCEDYHVTYWILYVKER